MDILEQFAKDAETQGIKYAVSKQVFCPIPTCGKVLDYRTTVVINNNVIICELCFIKAATNWIAPEHEAKFVEALSQFNSLEYVGNNQNVKELITKINLKVSDEKNKQKPEEK